MTDIAGLVVNSYEYDSYGNFLARVETVVQPYGYTAREQDEESDLYYYRARYYDPNTGRFISEDPSRFAGGDQNLYRYVSSNPLNFSDPFGLMCSPAAQTAIEAISNILGGAAGGVVAGFIAGGPAGVVPGALSGAVGGALTTIFDATGFSPGAFISGGAAAAIDFGVGVLTRSSTPGGIIGGAAGGAAGGAGGGVFGGALGGLIDTLVDDIRGAGIDLNLDIPERVARGAAGGLVGGLLSEFASDALQNALEDGLCDEDENCAGQN